MKLTTRWLAAALIILLLPVLASAQIDSGSDGIGIYFDTDATVVSTTAVTGDTVEAYLIATNLTQTGDIGIWSAGMCPGSGLVQIYGTPTHGGFNYSMNMPGDSCWSCLAFSFDTPLPVGNIVILANLEIEIYDDLEPVNIYLHADCSYGTFDGGDEEFPLYVSSGSSVLPVATINGVAPVGVESFEWDSIKAMYR